MSNVTGITLGYAPANLPNSSFDMISVGNAALYIPNSTISSSTIGFTDPLLLEEPLARRKVVNTSRRGRNDRSTGSINTLKGVRNCDNLSQLFNETPEDYRVHGGLYVVNNFDPSDYGSTNNKRAILVYNSELISDDQWSDLSNYLSVPFLTKLGETQTEIWLSKTGNDSTADGTETSPFSTFVKALEYIRTDQYIPELTIHLGVGNWIIDSTLLTVTTTLKIGKVVFIGETVQELDGVSLTGNTPTDGVYPLSYIFGQSVSSNQFLGMFLKNPNTFGGLGIHSNTTTELVLPMTTEQVLDYTEIHSLSTTLTVSQDLGTETDIYDCNVVLSSTYTNAEKHLFGCLVSVIGDVNIGSNLELYGCLIDASVIPFNVISSIEYIVMEHCYVYGSGGVFGVLPSESAQKDVQFRLTDCVFDTFGSVFEVNEGRGMIVHGSTVHPISVTTLFDNKVGSSLDLDIQFTNTGLTSIVGTPRVDTRVDITDSCVGVRNKVYPSSGVYVSPNDFIQVHGSEVGGLTPQTERTDYIDVSVSDGTTGSFNVGYTPMLYALRVVVEKLTVNSVEMDAVLYANVIDDTTIENFISYRYIDDSEAFATGITLDLTLDSANLMFTVENSSGIDVELAYRIERVLQ